MDGYLLLARCPRDDVPLRLFRGEEEALAFVRNLNGKSHLIASLVRPLVEGVFALDADSVLGVNVVRIRDGVPEWVEPALFLTEPVVL